MLHIKTEAENVNIKVSLLDLLRSMLNFKSVYNPTIIEDHHYDLDKLRHEGFGDRERAYQTLRYLHSNGYKSCHQIRTLIHKNQEDLIEEINYSYKGKIVLLIFLPALIACVCGFLFSNYALAITCLILLLLAFAIYVRFYLVSLGSIATYYYKDGVFRQILKNLDKKREYTVSYDLTIPLI